MEDPNALEPPLHRAARLGDVQEVARLVSEGAGINERSIAPFQKSLTPLMVAASSTDAETKPVVEWLLAHGADFRVTSEIETTAAWYAAGGKTYHVAYFDEAVLPDQVDRLRLLLDVGLDPNEMSINGQSLLFRACRAGDPARARLLLGRGASLNARTLNPEWAWAIPLFAAAESGSAECVQLLIDAGADVHERIATHKFRTPSGREVTIEGGEAVLCNAASPEIARMLIAAGAQVDAHDRHDDVLGRVLATANDKALKGNPEAFAVADVLLEAGACLDNNPYRKDSCPRLFTAAFSQQAAVVEYLLQRGASRESDERGATPLHAICWQRGTSDPADERIIRTLIVAGFSVADRDNEGRTPLHKATGGDGPHGTAVRVLLELGAEPNSIDEYGQTPLHLAAIRGGYECILALLASGADRYCKDYEGQTAIDYAEAEVKYQEEYAADEAETRDPGFENYVREWCVPNAQAVLSALKEEGRSSGKPG